MADLHDHPPKTCGEVLGKERLGEVKDVSFKESHPEFLCTTALISVAQGATGAFLKSSLAGGTKKNILHYSFIKSERKLASSKGEA